MCTVQKYNKFFFVGNPPLRMTKKEDFLGTVSSPYVLQCGELAMLFSFIALRSTFTDLLYSYSSVPSFHWKSLKRNDISTSFMFHNTLENDVIL